MSLVLGALVGVVAWVVGAVCGYLAAAWAHARAVKFEREVDL